MKNIKFLILAVLTSFLVFSCKDAIEIVQEGELNDQTTFKTVTDLNNYLLGSVYTSVDNSSQIKFSSVFTDEIGIAPGNSGWDFGLHRYILDATDAYASSIWINNYTVINRVNRLLKAASTIVPSAADQAKYNSILAEARTIRAYSYLELESYFTTNMKDDNALGVILTTSVPDILDQLPRVKNGDIYNLIESDLQFADANLATSYTTPNYYVSKNLVNALRARFYLYRGNYTLAQQYAQAVLSTSGLSLTIGSPYTSTTFYTTSTTNPYRKIWIDSSLGEVIFSLARPIGGTGGNVASLYTTNSTDINGSPLFDMGLNLYSILSTSTNDIRRYAFVDPTSTTNVKVIDKYPGKGNTPLRNDIKVFRLSEMYFILAECAAQSNNLTSAATYIKAVRDARKYSGTATLPVYATKIDALKDILRERRAELCFEGHRYVDLRRLGAEAGVSIDRNAGDDIISSTPLTLDITDHRFTLPIPVTEIAGNPSIQQNPGY